MPEAHLVERHADILPQRRLEVGLPDLRDVFEGALDEDVISFGLGRFDSARANLAWSLMTIPSICRSSPRPRTQCQWPESFSDTTLRSCLALQH